MPPELAGRASIKTDLDVQLKRIRSKVSKVACLALIGPRGCGKTTMMSWLKSKVNSGGVQVVQLKPSNVESKTDLATSLIGRGRGLTARAKFGGNFQQDFGSAGAFAELEGSSRAAGESADFSNILVAKAKRKPLVLLVDEAHQLNLEVAKTLYDNFQAAADLQPMMLLIAGTPDTAMHLQNAHVTFRERQVTYRIGRLDDGSSFDALAKPLRAYGIAFQESLVREAAREAQNYPYFLQCWGKSLWNALTDKRQEPSGDPGWDWFASLLPYHAHLGAKEYESAKDTAVNACRSLYGERMLEFKKHRISALVSELALQIVGGIDPGFAVKKFSTNLSNRWKMSDSSPPRNLPANNLEHSATQLLLYTGFVWETDPDRWEFGIPSLARHTAETVAKRMAVEMSTENGVSAFHAVLNHVSETQRTHDEIVHHLTSTGSAENVMHANVILGHLENDGILGPVGRKDPNGNLLLSILTPRLADAVIRELARVPRLEPGPTYDLDGLPFQ